MNQIIKGNIVPGPLGRPTMLVLTGDQIYADDVADPLLLMIMEYRKILFGWDERQDTIPANENWKFFPGHRGNIIVDEIGVIDARTADTKSHLISFGEYIMMYIMVWSPLLWKNGSIPTLTNLSSESVDYYERESEALDKFHSTLPEVRMLLANIPSYMMLDDHDITDDLFITAEWSEQMLGNDLMRRIIQNGFSAFTICQMWGNSPDKFQDGQPGKELLTAYNTIANSQNSENNQNENIWFNEIRKLTIPYLYEEADEEYWVLKRYPDSLKYNWHYEGNRFEIIATEGRTQRVYRQGYKEECGNLSEYAINEQIKNLQGPLKDVSFVLAGAPIFGVKFIESELDLADNAQSIEQIDRESWNLDEVTRHQFLSAIASRAKITSPKRVHKVIILSG